VVAHDVTRNAAQHAELIRRARSRLVVFPELSLTGYELDAEAIDPRDPRLGPIVDACDATGSVALVGAPVAGDHIAMLAIDATGVAIVYRKTYLGGDEPQRFVPGDTPAVLDVDGWRVGLAICKDLGVRQHASDTAALGIDAYVAGVLEAAADADLIEARAARVADDHVVWVAVASFAGSTGGGFECAAGGSSIRTPDGNVVARADSAPGAIATAIIG
jgi:predicted amidohydrolase